MDVAIAKLKGNFIYSTTNSQSAIDHQADWQVAIIKSCQGKIVLMVRRLFRINWQSQIFQSTDQALT